MSKKEKLIGRFLTMPSDFHYDEIAISRISTENEYLGMKVTTLISK